MRMESQNQTDSKYSDSNESNLRLDGVVFSFTVVTNFDWRLQQYGLNF